MNINLFAVNTNFQARRKHNTFYSSSSNGITNIRDDKGRLIKRIIDTGDFQATDTFYPNGNLHTSTCPGGAFVYQEWNEDGTPKQFITNNSEIINF